ncbi:MAG: NAD(P)H-hydrate epimerase [Elusimicrobiota bacterium]
MKSVTSAEMREIDRRATEEFGVASRTLMENAGKAVADAAESIAKSSVNKRILVLCGPGNNGGDGLVAARYLQNRGYKVKVLLIKEPGAFKGDTLENYKLAENLWLDMHVFGDSTIFRDYDVVIDALLGTGTKGEIAGAYKLAIDYINSSGVPVVSVDIPSGLDADTGMVFGTAVKAQITVTMALPKKGFENPEAAQYLGKLIIADIGIPEELLK